MSKGSDDVAKRYRRLQDAIGGCSDGYCVIKRPVGMQTNGGCRCAYKPDPVRAALLGQIASCAQDMADMLERLRKERDDLQVILDRERARGQEHDARVGKLHDKTLTLCAKATARVEKLRKFVKALDCECDSYFSFTCERCVALRETRDD